MALAGLIPFEYLAGADALVYTRIRALQCLDGVPPEPEAIDEITRQARRLAVSHWKMDLRAYSGKPVVGALLPLSDQWRERRHGRITYRMTQVLTGHGCFGEFLCRIGKEATAACHHCGEASDTAQHTLEVCPAFSALRRVLIQDVCYDLSLPALVGHCWQARGLGRPWLLSASK
ncbi:uncharacterized protein LOC143265176 [Megachile rotundata]|uniref:uncharacterized protein LOC143265176 n=1 Tax=Megachile rotundata TaxID=143995 RepID=UPI003FD46C8E